MGIPFEAALGPLDQNGEMIREFWRDVRDRWEAAEASLRRTVFYIGVLAMTFVLVETGGTSEISLLGLTFADFDWISLGVPVLIAYLSFTTFVNAAIAFRLQEVHDRLAQHYWPGMYDNDFELFVRPIGGIADVASVLMDSAIPYGVSALLRVSVIARFLVLLGAPVAFNVFALTQIWSHDPGTPAARWIVTSLCLLFAAASIPHLIYISKKREKNYQP